MKFKFAEGGKPNYLEKNPWVRLRLTNLSPSAEPRTRSPVVEVRGVTDDHYLVKNPKK
mgnify:CR=1 FL=1